MIDWRTSSYSASNGGCVAVGWRKSSYSSNGADCVEIAPAPVGVAVRDSKQPSGPILAFGPARWREFLAEL